MTNPRLVGHVMASTVTDTAAFAVVQLEGGARILAHGEPTQRPQAGDEVNLHKLNDEVWAMEVRKPA